MHRARGRGHGEPGLPGPHHRHPWRGEQPIGAGFELRPHTHLLTLAGSRAYGLHTETSDVDVKGFAVAPARWYHGFLRSFEQADHPEALQAFVADLPPAEQAVVARTKLEGSVYEVRKLFRLAVDANPNILDVLFSRDEDIRRITPLGEKVRQARDLFVTARCKHTFAGYASAQLKRIRLHRRWHEEGPEQAPSRAAYGLPEVTLVPKEQVEAAEAAIRKQLERWTVDWGELPEPERLDVEGQIARMLAELGLATEEARWAAAARWVGLGDNLIEIMQRERAYRAAQGEWRRFQRWKRERNPQRAALEARFGYDTKHAMHLVRLLRMAGEILSTGQVRVWRTDDADELRAIRAGAWTYDQLVAWAEAEEASLDDRLRQGDFVVPRAPDRERIDRLCVEIVEEALQQQATAG